HFQGHLLYTLRSKAEGGSFEGTAQQRQQRLLESGKYYDLIDLEGDRDPRPGLLAGIPPNKRLISWHGPATNCSGLKQRLERFSAVEARIYKLVPTSAQAGDELAALSLLKLSGRSDT